ncbi:nuclear factor 7, brain-like [Salvelinus fontinalis]|uniref:nuclear factor 7, brain-like n=1 Tax=Salvelinus fontinalis TaxID=8038 RepID=UPI0024857477|nr:nuclear factor 7, brain-like [Salvelinus fontinalis]
MTAKPTSQASLSEEDLLCPVCCEVFSLPVLLKCGHNSCKECLQKLWEWKGGRQCPVCRTTSSSERPPINLALKIAADMFTEQRTTRGEESTEEERCLLHNEKLKLFCHNDEEPICVVCQLSNQHIVHVCCPVEEAALEKKIEVSAKLDSLQKHLKILNKTKEDWEETKNYLKSQADQTERQMKEEFERFHQLLREEEKNRVAKLRQEEENKTQVMCMKLEYIKERIAALTDTISEVETSIRADDVKFLQDYKKTKSRTKGPLGDPECIRGILIDAAKHLQSLKFGIWKKMADIVQWVPITLDPNTAQSNLSFSKEFSSVRYSRKKLLPDNPERLTSRISVLGATGFTSGRHSWTVEVGQSRDWYIGVARESIKRKSTIFLNPAEGFWVIGLCNGETYWAQTSPRTRLEVKRERKPWRITIELDYDRGKVLFLNTVDSTLIHVFKEKFTERIFPYFAPGMYDEGNTSSPLTICPLTISIEVLNQIILP